MPRAKKNNSGIDHNGILQAVEQQYLAALRFSRDQINRKIAALESIVGAGSATTATQMPAKKTQPSTGPSQSKSSGKKAPRDYDMLKAKIKGPMTMEQLVKATDKQEGTLRQVMTNYPGLFKSDGKRPATYTLDSSR